MCETQGNRNFPDISGIDFNRRNLLKTGAASALMLGTGLGAPNIASASTTVKSTHGTGFCNLPLFLSHARQSAKEDGLTLEFVNTPTFAEHVTFLGTGLVDVGVLPYTSFVALYDAGAPVRIVAGSGIEGCAIVSQPGLDSAEKLKGKTLGTFQLDTLEVLPYDYLKANGVAMSDVNVRYVGNTPEAVEAFKAGALDWICTIEPYATSLLQDVEGSHLLSDGKDIYGANYTDCVLCARDSLIAENPDAIKALIKAMMKSQAAFEQETQAVLDEVVGTYYKTSMENAVIGATKQPPMVDQRANTDFILGRTDSLMEMGYIKAKPKADAINWSMLEAVIAENPDLYASLKIKSV